MKIPLWVLASSFGVTLPFLRYAVLPDYSKTKYSNKTVVITGPLGTLGQSLSFSLARKKCRLILACRDMERCKALRREILLHTNNKSIACRYLDLEDVESIDKFVDQISREEPRLDVLINNAAIKHTAEKELTKYGIDKILFVNFLAPFYLSIRLREKFLASSKLTGECRIINNVGTIKDSWKINYDDLNFDHNVWSSEKAYKQSKMALAYVTILMDKFHKERYQDIYVFGTNPCGRRFIDSMDYTGHVLDNITAVFKSWFMPSSISSVQPMIQCAIDPDMATRHASGKLYSYFLTYWAWPKKCQNELDAKLVWNKAVDLLNDLSIEKNNEPSDESANKVK